mmetsp:Transcript_59939/g.99483  ORF Transcript_59939/g.99483 Transcript_59939/m.99483 type:complete len:228 (-) Transcript_59939:106-789(-)
MQFIFAYHDVNAAPPCHVLRLLVKIVAHPAGERQHRDACTNKILLPSDLEQHVLHFAADLVIACLRVWASSISIHLVAANDKLLHAEKVDKTCMLTGLALHLSCFVVAFLNGGGEVTVRRNHEKSDIGLSGTGNHILNEIPVARRVNDSVVPLLSEELFCSARYGHTTLALLLLTVHVESKSERRFAQTFCLGLELFHLTFGNTAKLEQKTTGRGRLARVDVTANDN